MKPFLGIDITTNKKNEEFNGDSFLVQKPSLALAQSLERSQKSAEDTIEKSKLPLPIRIGQWICGLLGAVIVLGIVKGTVSEDGVSIVQAYKNAPWLFWLAGILLAVWGLLKLISIKKEKAVLETDESTQVIDHLDRNCDAIFSELSVPSDAREVDVLSFFYRVKGDDIKVSEKGLQIAPYMNPVFSVFADSENLYLANLEGKYAFPLSSIKEIKTIKKSIRIISWNKDEPCNKGIYKEYKLSEDDYGCVLCKKYHIMQVEQNGEMWGVYIPCYELPIFEELTGLKANEI